MTGLDLQSLLGLSVIAAVISTLGALTGVVIKDFYFSRSFDAWKRKQDQDQVYQKFRDPLLVAAMELVSRLHEVISSHPAPFLHSSLLETIPSRQLENSDSDPYYLRYKLISTIYRFCCFFGWLELYRQELTFLKSESDPQAEALERVLYAIRSDVADGEVNNHPDWERWHDILIFREELRAIGESMIDDRGEVRAVVGYGKFCELVDAPESNRVKHWAGVAMNFLLDPQTEPRDFRRMREMRLVVHLAYLIELLRPSALRKHFRDARQEYLNCEDAWTLERSRSEQQDKHAIDVVTM